MGVMGSMFKNLAGSAGKGHVTTAGIIGGVAFAPFTYMEKKDEGWSGAGAAAYAGAEAAAWIFAEPLMWGVTLAGAAGSLTKMAVEDARDNANTHKMIRDRVYEEGGTMKGTLGGTFVDNEQAATMRQRNMQLLRQHRLSTESILGSEARQLHR